MIAQCCTSNIFFSKLENRQISKWFSNSSLAKMLMQHTPILEMMNAWHQKSTKEVTVLKFFKPIYFPITLTATLSNTYFISRIGSVALLVFCLHRTTYNVFDHLLLWLRGHKDATPSLISSALEERGGQ
jgi:hypothetical protein